MRQPLKSTSLLLDSKKPSITIDFKHKEPKSKKIVIEVCWWANLDDQVGLGDDDEECDVGPGEERELPHVVLLLQRKHEPHKPKNVPEFKNEIK